MINQPQSRHLISELSLAIRFRSPADPRVASMCVEERPNGEHTKQCLALKYTHRAKTQPTHSENFRPETKARRAKQVQVAEQDQGLLAC